MWIQLHSLQINAKNVKGKPNSLLLQLTLFLLFFYSIACRDASSEVQLQRIQSQLAEIESLLQSLTNPSTSSSNQPSNLAEEAESDVAIDRVNWLFVMGHYPILSNGAHVNCGNIYILY